MRETPDAVAARVGRFLDAITQIVILTPEAGEGLAGTCLGADDDGALLLETSTGIQRILSGGRETG